MSRELAGLKVRAERRRRGLTQGELARRAGISASYLNLIEANKRPAGGALLDRIAKGLGVERGLLDGEAERRLVDELNEVAADAGRFGNVGARSAAEEFVGRNPGWAELLLGVYRAYRDRSQAVLALADRLNRDPFLGESVHRMLTHVTSIRSAAEIVAADEALAPADRTRFLAIIGDDSAALTQTAKALVDFFDSAHTRIHSATHTERVDAFLFEAQNHFPELEDFADAWLARRSPDDLAAAVPTAPDADDQPGTDASERFRRLRAAAGEAAAAEMDVILARHAALADPETEALARRALAAYAAAALLMPYQPFLEAAETCRYDLDTLAHRFGVTYEQAAHRLVTLRRPGAEGVRFAFMRSDASGYITKRLPLPRLPMPRYGNACPLWPVYGAFQSPGVTVRGFGRLPSGDDFLFFARAIDKRPARPGTPRHLLSVMLACAGADAARVAAADGIDRATATGPVGTICRLCPRTRCAHRQEPQLVA